MSPLRNFNRYAGWSPGRLAPAGRSSQVPVVRHYPAQMHGLVQPWAGRSSRSSPTSKSLFPRTKDDWKNYCRREGQQDGHRHENLPPRSRSSCCAGGRGRSETRVLVLVEEGSKPASRSRGPVKSYSPRWNEATFSSREDLLMAARQFCWNVSGG